MVGNSEYLCKVKENSNAGLLPASELTCLVGNIFYYVGCEERPDPWLYNNKITLFKLVISIGKYVLALWAWSGEVNSLFSLFSFFFHNWTQIS